MNDGIAVPFFGRDAMTAPALAQFARHFSIPILPVRVVRLGPARFPAGVRSAFAGGAYCPYAGDKPDAGTVDQGGPGFLAVAASAVA